MFNIMIVEDNVNNMRLFNQVLMDVERELNIVEAYTGEQAIETSKNQTFDIVLMDIALPDIDGVEARRQLVKLSHFKNTIFIAVTAHSSEEDKHKLELEFDYYLSKPIDDDELVELIEKLLE